MFVCSGNTPSDADKALPFGLVVEGVTDTPKKVKDQLDNAHCGDLVGNDPRTLEDCAKPFKLEELYMPKNHRHAVDHRVHREDKISQRD